jgi:peptidoglycan/LPS O-acetylase OafA/YrhL
MVAVFFVISGYVLTHRFLTLVHQDKPESALMSMSSATFRRFVRLYGPVFVFTAMLQVFIQLGLFEHGRPRFDNRTPYPPRADTVWGQFLLFWTWWRDAVNPFTFSLDYNGNFDPHIWTIPIEYRCSMVLFLVAVGLARVKTKLQIPFMVAIMAWTMNTVHWELILFLIGMILAQIDVLLQARKESLTLCGNADQVPRWKKQWLWYPVMLVAVYLCSLPWFHDNALGFVFLSQIDPFPIYHTFNTWGVLGATMLVVCALHWPPFQRFLKWQPIQYLGHISYPLYIVHGALDILATYSLKWDVFELLKSHFQPGNEEIIHSISVWISFLCFMPGLIVLSDIFCRGVDIPMVNLSHKVWEYCTK